MYTFRRINLPPNLHNKLTLAHPAGFSRKLATQLITKPQGLSQTIQLDSPSAFLEFIATVFAQNKNTSLTLFFKRKQWKLLSTEIHHGFDLGIGDYARLMFSLPLYQNPGKTIPLALIAQTMCQKNHAHELKLTKPVYTALESLTHKCPAISQGTIIRAAHLFYESGLGNKPPLSNPSLYIIDNTKTGWTRTSFLAGDTIQENLQAEHAHGTTNNITLSHTLYSFLQEILQ